jgi:hypothetical protein
MILCKPRREMPHLRLAGNVTVDRSSNSLSGAVRLSWPLCTLMSPVRNAGLKEQKMAAPPIPSALDARTQISRLSLHRKSIGFALRATSGTSTAAKFFSMSATPTSLSSSSFPTAWKLCSRASTANAPSPSIVPAAIGHPMLDELHRPLVTHVVEEATIVRIEYPVHSLSLDAHSQGV